MFLTLEDLEYSHMDHFYGAFIFMSLFVILKLDSLVTMFLLQNGSINIVQTIYFCAPQKK